MLKLVTSYKYKIYDEQAILNCYVDYILNDVWKDEIIERIIPLLNKKVDIIVRYAGSDLADQCLADGLGRVFILLKEKIIPPEPRIFTRYMLKTFKRYLWHRSFVSTQVNLYFDNLYGRVNEHKDTENMMVLESLKKDTHKLCIDCIRFNDIEKDLCLELLKNYLNNKEIATDFLVSKYNIFSERIKFFKDYIKVLVRGYIHEYKDFIN